MSIISFYSSIFDNSIILGSSWLPEPDTCLKFPYERQNIIAEEYMWNDIKSSGSNNLDLLFNWRLESFTGYRDLALLYRRFKTALDRTKDYHEASWAYFNEFEMKRRALKAKIEKGIPNKIIFKFRPFKFIYGQLNKIFSRYCLYNLYKIFAGYGEKPLWSFSWYMFSAIIFSIAHFVSGMDINGMGGSPDEIQFSNYSCFSDLLSIKLIYDLGKCLLYTLSLTIPRSFVSTTISGYYDAGAYGQIISSFNSIIMILFLAMIAVGLKRHFRRF